MFSVLAETLYVPNPSLKKEPCMSPIPQGSFLNNEKNPPGQRGGCPPRFPQIRTCPIRAYGSSSHRFTFRSAIRGGCGDRVIEVRCPRPVSPPRLDDSAPPSLRRVQAEAVPLLQRYYEALRLLAGHFAALRYPSFGDTSPALGFRFRCCTSAAASDLGLMIR